MQARHVLSKTEAWTQDDGSFDNYEFFKMVVSLFEDDADSDEPSRSEWAAETLDWWQM